MTAMTSTVQFDSSPYGVRAVLTGTWTTHLRTLLLDRQVSDLELNDSKGWRGADLGFLRDLPHLRALKIIDLRITSIEPIHELHELRAREVITYCNSEIRFSEFPLLRDCSLEWRPRAGSLFGCTTLHSLFLNRFDESDTHRFARLLGLESLALMNSSANDLRGLGALRNLRKLRLAGMTRLRSLAGLEGANTLEELMIEKCRGLRSIAEIGQLRALRHFGLIDCGRIESLKPLVSLGNLESVLFYESTNIEDGDLSPLLDKRRLVRVSFMNRPHYSHRREDFRS